MDDAAPVGRICGGVRTLIGSCTLRPMAKWVTRWKYEISASPSAQGIWALKSGGYLIRVRVKHPKTGERRDALRTLRNAKLAEAKHVRAGLMAEERARTKPTISSRMLFAKYAASLFKKRVDAGHIASAKTRERWSGTLTHLVAELGSLYVDEIDLPRLEEMHAGWATRIQAKRADPEAKDGLAPTTANGWINILRTIFKRATKELKLPENPALDVGYFSLKTHRPYTREKPNALTIEWARKFLASMLELQPQHYAMTLLGFVTGLRPSSLRPIRRAGETPDVLWNERVVIARRSHSMRQEVMDSTKTGIDIVLALPADVMQVLRWHTDMLGDPPMTKWKKPPLWWRKEMATSELLFPARHGGLRSRSTLDKPFAEVCSAIGLPFRLTPRGMRRTFKDLARASGVTEVASKEISGHQTEEMHEHYQTVLGDEMRAELSKISSLIFKPSGVGTGVGKGSADA